MVEFQLNIELLYNPLQDPSKVSIEQYKMELATPAFHSNAAFCIFTMKKAETQPEAGSALAPLGTVWKLKIGDEAEKLVVFGKDKSPSPELNDPVEGRVNNKPKGDVYENIHVTIHKVDGSHSHNFSNPFVIGVYGDEGEEWSKAEPAKED